MPSDLDFVLPRCAKLVESVCNLPGAPVPNWGELAANALHQLSPTGLVAVTIATNQPNSPSTDVQCVGIKCDNAERVQIATRRLQRPIAHNQPTKPGIQNLSQHALLRELASADFAQASLWTASKTLRESGDLWLNLYVVLPRLADNLHDAALCETIFSVLSTRAEHALPSSNGVIRWLTRREAEVLDQLVLGYSIREIAEILTLSHHTVQDHVKHLHTKLEAGNRGEVVARALGKRETVPKT